MGYDVFVGLHFSQLHMRHRLPSFRYVTINRFYQQSISPRLVRRSDLYTAGSCISQTSILTDSTRFIRRHLKRQHVTADRVQRASTAPKRANATARLTSSMPP